MACKRYTMNEVVAELDRSDFEDSEDDLDGYLDMKSDYEAYTYKKRDGAVEGNEERTEKEDDLIGTNRDREWLIYWAAHWHFSKYTLQPGGSAPVNVINYYNARNSNLYLRLFTHKDHSKMPSRTSARRYSLLAAQRSMHSTMCKS